MLDQLNTPVRFLHRMLGEDVPLEDVLIAYQDYMLGPGQEVSDAVDRMGTVHLQMYDAVGERIDRIQYPPEYWTFLHSGYCAGTIWRCFEGQQVASVLPFVLLGYLTSFIDPGVFCPHTVSMSTAVPLSKYGQPELVEKYLPPLLRDDEQVWQGATWMTEVDGGSDLGRGVITAARHSEDSRYLLSGDKYFASNAHAELAVVAARPEGAVEGVRGVALFLVPRWRDDGTLNLTIRRLKDKIGTRSVPTGEVELRDAEGYLLGPADKGIYLVLEVLNISRVANSIGSVAIAQRAVADAWDFGGRRIAFGRPVREHPLLLTQFEAYRGRIEAAFALAWEAANLLDEVIDLKPPYNDRYHLFRLVAHLAKYHTAELAKDAAAWAIEAFGGVGTLAENRVERWQREAMILSIWEGSPHRQMLDGMEVMERKGAHHLLAEHLKDCCDPDGLDALIVRIDAHLTLPQEVKEGGLQAAFEELAEFTARALRARLRREAEG